MCRYGRLVSSVGSLSPTCFHLQQVFLASGVGLLSGLSLIAAMSRMVQTGFGSVVMNGPGVATVRTSRISKGVVRF